MSYDKSLDTHACSQPKHIPLGLRKILDKYQKTAKKKYSVKGMVLTFFSVFMDEIYLQLANPAQYFYVVSVAKKGRTYR